MTTDYTGIKGLYFKKLLQTLVDVGGLRYRTVLDFGCGTQQLKRFLPEGTTYIGYDIQPHLSDVRTLENVKFDIMVANEVFYEMSETDIKIVLNDLRPQWLVVGIGRKGWLNKLGAMLLEPTAHDHYKTPPEKELDILLHNYKIVKHKNVWFLADVYLMQRV